MTNGRISEPRIVQDDACRGTVVWEALVFTVWRPQPMSADSIRQFGRVVLEQGRLIAPKKVTLVAMLSEAAPTPSNTLVPLLLDNARVMAPFLRAQATIARTSGVRAAAKESIVSALMIAARGGHEERSFGLDADAVPWVFEQTRVDVPAITQQAVRDAFGWVRERVY